MRNRTAHKTVGNPLRTLGLSIAFAGTVLATSAASVAAMPMAHDTLTDSGWVGGVPHQVAPFEGQDTSLPAPRIALPTSLVDSGVPHQVAPFEGENILLPAIQIAAFVDSGVPHQVAPFEGENE